MKTKSLTLIYTMVLTQNHYYVIEDNFENSHDSRYFGYLNFEL